ncbi:hypothetical protein HAX54_042921 [Datura stramonium]|uniref:Uncharacterized protein n=1 Tax=Datura stramonium TaxID=4076 RepID=A0ABS8W2I9_DATST|nr:hypothetical protein [Datura stramonium]
MEDLKKRIRVDRDNNQHKRVRSVGYNDRNTDKNLFNGKSLDKAPSTTSAPPTIYRNDKRGQNNQGQNSRAPGSQYRAVLHKVIRSNFLVTDVVEAPRRVSHGYGCMLWVLS